MTIFRYDPLHTRKVLDLACDYNHNTNENATQRKAKQEAKSEQMRNAANKRWENERNKKSEEKTKRKNKHKKSFVTKDDLKNKYAEYKKSTQQIIKNLKTLVTKQENELIEVRKKAEDDAYDKVNHKIDSKVIDKLNQSIKEKTLDIDKLIIKNNELIQENKAQAEKIDIFSEKIDSVIKDRRDLQFRINSADKETANSVKYNKELKAQIKTQAEELAKMEYISKESAKMCLDSENRMKELSNGNDLQKATPHKEN